VARRRAADAAAMDDDENPWVGHQSDGPPSPRDSSHSHQHWIGAICQEARADVTVPSCASTGGVRECAFVRGSAVLKAGDVCV
jgi:hypothetical protein